MQKFEFKAKVWLYPGEETHSTGSGRSAGAWHFVSLPMGLSRDLKKWFGEEARGWGSLPVEVEIGKSKWKTSIFPDSKSGCFLLPLKASIRKVENVKSGMRVVIGIRIMV